MASDTTKKTQSLWDRTAYLRERMETYPLHPMTPAEMKAFMDELSDGPSGDLIVADVNDGISARPLSHRARGNR